MLKIRLTRTGKRNAKQYRIVAIEEGKRRDGKAVEILGFYNPLVKPPQIKIERERVDYWISKGAVTTSAVQKLIESNSK